MSLLPLTMLVCISQDIPRTTIIHNLLTFFANADGMTRIVTTKIEKPISGTFPLEFASALLNQTSDAELNQVLVSGMLGDLECLARFYLPDKPLMVEQPRFIELSIEEGLMSRTFRDKERDPLYSDHFAISCIAFCEQIHAFFAPFSWLQFEGVCERLAWYGQDPLYTYICSFVHSDPLVYCDASTYEMLLQIQDPNFHPRKLISLPSGAKAIYNYSYMPWFSINEIPRSIEWLRRSLTPHLDIQGVIDLINYLKDFEDYFPLASSEEEEEIFHQLDTIRLLWATALQRQGVLSVMLPTKGAARAGIIPIIAGGGCEWCLYNDQQIDDFDASAWSGPGGIWTYALALRDAAQMFPINGVPPRVVVVAWPPFSHLAHAALTEAGVIVISSMQLVPLIIVA